MFYTREHPDDPFEETTDWRDDILEGGCPPTTKLRGTPQGSSASSSKLYEIGGKGKGQDSPTLVKFDFSKLEKEVKEGGNTTKLLERFQSILIETGKELKELREKHYESNNGTNKSSRRGP